MTVKVHKSSNKGMVIIVLIILAVAVLSSFIGIILSDSANIDLEQESITLNIEEGSGASLIAEQFKAQGVIKYPLTFKLQAKLGNYTDKIRPGSITIENGMSYNEILELLCSDMRGAKTVVIPEGFEQKQIAQRLEEEGICSAADFMAAAFDEYDYSFTKILPDRESKLEGYLYPDTYMLLPNTPAHEVIETMLSEFDKQVNDEMRARAKELEMPLDDIITLASIIERETDSDAERAKVAGVFYNRINQGMKLQSCATVQYILGERKPVLSVADTQIQSPYNTYLNAGLPVGPIANPGIECIKAALYPEDTEYLYFVAGPDGQHIFSKTYEEHLNAQ